MVVDLCCRFFEGSPTSFHASVAAGTRHPYIRHQVIMPQAEDGSKLSTEEYQILMKEFGIVFEGRIIPEQWGEYTELFQEIRRIGEIRPEEFIKKFTVGDDYIVEKQVMASKLTEEAHTCLEHMDSEYGWRKEVEFNAFECFDSEVVW